MRWLIPVFLCLSFASAQGIRRIPPLGIKISTEDQALFEKGLAELKEAMLPISKHPLLPDVEIFYKGTYDALKHQEFQKPNELSFAKNQLREGLARAKSLKNGKAPWNKQTGLVVRGFRSEIDGSVQPYGLVIPKSYDFSGDQSHRLDFWFHGRDDKVNEVHFMERRRTQAGQYTPAETIVLHPYARFSNANKFAGEIDCLEALAHAKKNYRIDDDRIAVRGFSMGGAACWQFAVHYADQWCVANPGAGFSETEEFLKMCGGKEPAALPFQRTLWHLYDCTDYAANLTNLPTVAYSGEIDQQKQAADMMESALKKRGLPLTHIIGPKTAHKIEAGAKEQISKLVDAAAKSGRQRFPKTVRFETYTLRYHKLYWTQIDRMEEHWKRAYLKATYSSHGITIEEVENISALTLSFPTGHSPFHGPLPIIKIAGQKITAPANTARRSWEARLFKESGTWKLGLPPVTSFNKHHLMQGPIDDAFMSSFLFVTPGKTTNDPFGIWEKSERNRAMTHWRQQFRGDVRVKADIEIDNDEIGKHNLILWGNPSTNTFLARIMPKLPIQWDSQKITVGSKTYDANKHALIMIYPNPLYPIRYVVLNSSFTYREFDYLNNARQVPKLPDWAIIDLSEKPGPNRPGKIVDAGFFDENWKLKKVKE